MAFGFGFCALLGNNIKFDHSWSAISKIMVMTLGELNYDDIFFGDKIWCGDPPVGPCLPYPTTTHIFFLVFGIIMPIITVNLLVGLAVGDIHAVLESAKLQRLSMQVMFDIFNRLIVKFCLHIICPTR